MGAWQRGASSGGVLRCACTPILSAGERYEKWDDCSYDDGGGGGSPDNRRELGGRVWWWWGGWGGVAGVEKYNFSSSIAVSVITACHA